MGERRLHADKKIDVYNLEKESSEQPSIFLYWARNAADLKKDRDVCKNALKKLEGQTEVKIWTGKYKLPVNADKKPIKLTGDTVKALLNADSDIIIARDELAEAEQLWSKAAAAEETMQQRRSMINNAVELYKHEYYSHTGADGTVMDRTEQKKGTQKKALNKKKKKSEE